MRKMKKKSLVLLSLVIILIGTSISGFVIHQQRQEELRMKAAREVEEAEREAELEVIYTYIRLIYAFGLVSDPAELEGSSLEALYVWSGTYGPLMTSPKNDHMIWTYPYLALRFYYHRTGIELSWEFVMDYFSEEFEPDGTLRLYNNGHHPEMEAFVIWMWEGRRREEVHEYRDTINHIRSAYTYDHRDEGFTSQPLHQLSPQMLDALARAEADPDYELDLMSLQEAGY